MNYKLLIGGIVLIAAIVLGVWFWGQLSFNQQELASMPISEESQQDEESSTSADSEVEVSSDPSQAANDLESELSDLDLEDLDSEELDLSGL
jgi:cytoskeletal protein RodZ